MTAEIAKAQVTTEQPKPQNPQPKPAQQEQTNCLACNKPIKKLKRYYRNGKFYCNKECWRKSKLKAKEEKK